MLDTNRSTLDGLEIRYVGRKSFSGADVGIRFMPRDRHSVVDVYGIQDHYNLAYVDCLEYSCFEFRNCLGFGNSKLVLQFVYEWLLSQVWL